uniref:B30.2/SPRY domain-containing protein n=1 Tax=Poecilia reticulata TaxID=8081 RepID=A0A3P9Q1P2_POERE
SEESPRNLASALKPMISNLRELELSENILMDSLLTVIADLSYPDHPDRFGISQVLCIEGLTGRHYWEAECYMSSDIDVGVAYKSIPRQGDCSSEISLAGNEKAWSWNTTGCFYHNNYCQTFLKSDTCSIGIYLDWPAGVLSFFDVSRDAVTHLYTVHTTFTEPLHPGFGLTSGSVCIKEKKIYK